MRVGVYVRARKTLYKGTVKKVDKSEQNGRYSNHVKRDVPKPKTKAKKGCGGTCGPRRRQNGKSVV